MSGYDAGTAFLQIVPSFKGVVTSISAEAAKWGAQAGKAFKDSFEAATKGLAKDSLGPSAEESGRRGAEAGGAFADGFKAKVDAALKSLPDARIGADASPAERKIAEVRAKLAELSSKKIGVDIDDKTALVELDALKKDLKRIGASSPNIRVRVDAAAALAELEAVDRASKDAGDGLLSKLTPGANAAAGGLSGLTKAALVLAPALIPIGAVGVAGLAGMIPLVTGLATGFGAIALVAKPAFTAVKDAVQATTKAQQAYNKAVASGNTKLAAKDLKILQQTVAGIPGPVKAAAAAWVSFDSVYHKWAAAFQPQIFSIMASGLHIAQGAFKSLTPIVSGSLTAIQKFMPQLKAAVDGPGSPFGQFAEFMSTEAPNAISGFLNAMLKLGEGFGNLVIALAPLGGQVGTGLGKWVDDFLAWSKDLDNDPSFQHFVGFIQSTLPTVVTFLHNLGHALGDLVTAAAPVGKAVLDLFNAFAKGFGKGGGAANLKTFGDDLGKILDKAAPLATVLGTTLAKGIGTFAKAVGGMKLGPLVKDLTDIARVAGPGFMSGFSSVFAAAAPALTIIVGGIASLVKNNPKLATWAAVMLGGAVAIGKIASALRLANLAGFVKQAIALTGAMTGLEGVGAVLAFGGLVAAAAAALYIVTHQKQIKAALTQSPVPNTSKAVQDQPASNPDLGIPKIIGNVKDAASQISGIFSTLAGQISSSLSGLGGIIAGAFSGAFGTAEGIVSGGVSAVVGFFAPLPGEIAGILTGVGGTLSGVFSGAFGAAEGIVSGGVSAVVGFFTALPGQIVGILSSIGSTLSGIFTGALGAVEGVVSAGLAAVVGFFAALPGRAVGALASLAGAISGVASAALSAMGGAVSAGVGTVVSFFAGLPGRAVAALSALVGDLQSLGSSAMTAMRNGIVSGAAAVIGFVAGLPGEIIGALGSLYGAMYSAGRNAVQGLLDGLGSLAGAVASKAASIAGSIASLPKKILGIFSPSKVMRQIGVFAVQGLIQGLDSQVPGVASATGRMVSPLLNPIDARVFTRGSVDLSGAGLAGALAGGSSAPVVGTLNVTAYDPSEAARKTAAEIGWQQKTRGR